MPHVKAERSSPEMGSDERESDNGVFNGLSVDEERSTGNLLCLVCGDVATGRHYGSVACNGCKGFFRRTIRRNYKYTCRFSGNCQIDRHNRAVCRACRYARCVKFGMKVEAVQSERDLIGKRPRTYSATTISNNSPPTTLQPSTSTVSNHFPQTEAQLKTITPAVAEPIGGDPWDHPKALLELLMKSEEKIRNMRDSVIKETGKVEYTTKREPHGSESGRKATYNDILHSLHSQLLLVIEWAKTLKPFAELCTEDQTALLKNFASQHIVLCVAYRSINASDFLKLINDTCIPRVNGDEGDDFYRKDCERVMDTLVAPMRFMQMDDVEFVMMKACVLFNPVARGLSNESVMKVLDTRRRIFAALEHYVRSKTTPDPNRIGDLTFFILSPLQSLAKSISEDVLVTKLSGMARIDMLMDELILEVLDTEPKKNAMDLRRSLSETDENYSEMNTIQIPTSSNGNSNMVRSAPTNYNNLEFRGFNNTAPKDMSPIHDYEMMSTLSSYVFGGTLQSPLSPTNDVLFSSAAAPSIMSDSKLSTSNISDDHIPISSPPNWTTLSNARPYDPTNYSTSGSTYPATPLNY